MGGARTAAPRRLLGGLVGVLGLAALVGGWAAGVALALMVLASIAITPSAPVADQRRPSDPFAVLLAWLPIGAAVALAIGVAAVVVSTITRVPLWSPDRAPVTLGLLLVGLTAWPVVRGGRVALWSPQTALAWVPAVGYGLVAGARMLEPMAVWSRPAWVLTDWVNNAEMTVDLVKHGWLEYAVAAQSADGPVSVYPRGLHAMIAWLVSGTSGGGTVPEAWHSAITALFATSVITAVLVLAAAGLAAVVAVRAGRGGAVAAVVAVAATALAFLHPLVHGLLVRAGFVTSAAGLLVLFALVLLASSSRVRGRAERVMLASLLTMLAFHLWQLLALPAAGVVALLLWRWWRGSRERMWAVGLILGASVVACAPLARVTVSGTGADQASIPANVQGMPLAVSVVVVVLAVVPTAAVRRRVPAAMAFLVLQAGLVVLAVALTATQGGLVAGDGGAMLPYYALKVAWQATVLALPVAVAVVVVLVSAAWRAARRRWGSVTAFVVVVPPIVLGLAAVVGFSSFGITTTVSSLVGPTGPSPQVAMLALDSPQVRAAPGRPVLPYLLHPQGWQLWLRYDDWHAAQMLRTDGHPVPGGDALLGRRIAALCGWLEAHPDAVRLTGPRRGDADLIARGCPSEIVRPAEWIVLTSPPEWWTGTDWEATGGAPDPAIVAPDVLLDRLPGAPDTPAENS